MTVAYSGCGHEFDFDRGEARVFATLGRIAYSPIESSKYFFCPICRGLIDSECETALRNIGCFRGPPVKKTKEVPE